MTVTLPDFSWSKTTRLTAAAVAPRFLNQFGVEIMVIRCSTRHQPTTRTPPILRSPLKSPLYSLCQALQRGSAYCLPRHSLSLGFGRNEAVDLASGSDDFGDEIGPVPLGSISARRHSSSGQRSYTYAQAARNSDHPPRPRQVLSH